MNDSELLKHAITRIATLQAKLDMANQVISRQEERIRNLEITIDSIQNDIEELENNVGHT